MVWRVWHVQTQLSVSCILLSTQRACKVFRLSYWRTKCKPSSHNTRSNKNWSLLKSYVTLLKWSASDVNYLAWLKSLMSSAKISTRWASLWASPASILSKLEVKTIWNNPRSMQHRPGSNSRKKQILMKKIEMIRPLVVHQLKWMTAQSKEAKCRTLSRSKWPGSTSAKTSERYKVYFQDMTYYNSRKLWMNFQV